MWLACTWFLKIVSVQMSVCVHVCLRKCLPPEAQLIISGMIWTLYDWVSKFYSFYMAAIVDIVGRGGLTIEVHHGNQPSRSKLALCTLWIHFNRHLKQLYTNNKVEYFSYKRGCSVVGVHVSRCLKEKSWFELQINSFRLLVI